MKEVGTGFRGDAYDPPRLIEDGDVVFLLQAGVFAAGSQRAYAVANGFHEGNLSQVLRERRAPTAGMLRAVGVERLPVLVCRAALDASQEPELNFRLGEHFYREGQARRAAREAALRARAPAGSPSDRAYALVEEAIRGGRPSWSES